jgi:outer membrane receptor for ferrienterochelin and colicins
MKKIISLIICLLVVCTYIQADETQQNRATDANIFGHVIDRKTNEHLPFATIRLQGTVIGITTDATGHYFFRNLPVGSYTLEVSMVGFNTITREVTITANSTQEINFYLDEDRAILDEVVVSANRTETIRRLAPTLVNIIGRSTLEATGSQTLAEGLRFMPGMRVESICANCGGMQVRMSGLDGAYSQILIDSRPMIGALASGYSLDQIPSNMIERIEVVRGGGSALFGSNAVAGTINVITREPIRNSGEFAHTITSLNEHNTVFNTSLINDTRSAGIAVYGQHRRREATDLDGDGFSNILELKNRTLGFRSFLRTSTHSRLTLDYHNRHEFRRGGDSLELQPFKAHLVEQVEHLVNGASLNFEYFRNPRNRFNLYSAFQHTKRNIYTGAGDPFVSDVPPIFPGMTQDEIDEINDILENNELRINAFGHTAELVYQIGGQFTRTFDHLWFMPALLTTGLEYVGSDLVDVSGLRDDRTQRTGALGAFAQNEWRTDKWSFLVGARLDNHNLVDNPIFSPRLNVRFNPTGNLNFRASYGEGFRAPQLFDHSFHIELAGGERFVRTLSDDLREERSRSVNVSADYAHQVGNIRFNALAEGFYTRLIRPFTETTIGNEIIIENADDGAAVYGVNFEAGMTIRSLFDFRTGITLQRSLYDDEESWFESDDPDDEEINRVDPTRRMLRTPNTYAYFVAAWSPVRRFSTSLSGTYTGSMLVPHFAGFGGADDRFSEYYITRKTPSFFELNVRFSYDFDLYADTKFQLNAGVQNIFNAFQRDLDTGRGKDAGFVYGPLLPRMFFAGVKLMF